MNNQYMTCQHAAVNELLKYIMLHIEIRRLRSLQLSVLSGEDEGEGRV